MCVIIKMELDSQSSVSAGSGGTSFNWNLNHIRIDASSEAQVLSSLQSAGLTYVEAMSAIRLFRDLPAATSDNQKQRILVNSRNLVLYFALNSDFFSIAETGEKLHDLGQQRRNYSHGEACGIIGILGRRQNCRHNDQAELLERLFAEYENLAGIGSCDRKLVVSPPFSSSALTKFRQKKKPIVDLQKNLCVVVKQWYESEPNVAYVRADGKTVSLSLHISPFEIASDADLVTTLQSAGYTQSEIIIVLRMLRNLQLAKDDTEFQNTIVRLSMQYQYALAN